MFNREDIVDLNPNPREVKKFDPKDKKFQKVFDYEAIEFLSNLQKYGFDKFPKWGLKFDELIYVLRFYGVGPHMVDWTEICSLFRDQKEYNIDKIIEFGRLNGYEISTDDLILLINNIDFNRNPIENWIKLSVKFKNLKEHVDKIVRLAVNNKSISEEDSEFLRKNKVYINFLDIDKKLLTGYPELKKLSEEAELVRLFKKVLPDFTVQNYAYNTIKNNIKSVDANKSDIDPKTIVNYFYPKLKNKKFNFGRYGVGGSSDLNFIPTIYMICSLVKMDKINLLDELNIDIGQTGMKYLIRILFDLEKYNTKGYLREDFRLTDEEREKLCSWILMNKKIIKNDYSNQIVPDRELYQHEAVYLIYYYYDWGFNKYFDIIKKSKNQADKWVVVDGVNSHQQGRNRIDYFSEIFNYLDKNKMQEELTELKEKIKQSMILKKNELESLNSNSGRYISI